MGTQHLRRVDVHSRKQAEALEPKGNQAIISITAPGKAANLKPGWRAILRLEFHDITEQWEVDREGLTMFSEAHADSIRNFMTLIETASNLQDSDIVVHCDAGVSRSVAVGVYLRDVHACELHLHATPNPSFANQTVLRTLMRKHWEEHFNA